MLLLALLAAMNSAETAEAPAAPPPAAREAPAPRPKLCVDMRGNKVTCNPF